MPFLLRRSALLLAAFLASVAAAAQPADLSFLTTRAEATGFNETTRYEEVMAFLDVLDATSERLFVRPFGYSTEGRALPLAVFGDVRDGTPAAVRASGKTRVFIQANIHAGEVCGKEAMLMLLRRLAAGGHPAWADSLVLLIAPLYNADGNERVSLYNRPEQNGPVGGMGQRANAQGYDLNRDHMKLDAPETRSLVGLFNAYDPHVVIDLHTTDGTYHAYHLTYAPPLHPNTPPTLTRLLRDEWLPAATKRLWDEGGWRSYYYGNLPWPGQVAPRGWYTFDHRPRFNTHYAGLRNRIGILSEAYAYASFEDRIRVTLDFVVALIDGVHAEAGRVRRLVDAADRSVVAGDTLALRATLERSAAPVEILMGEVERARHPYTGAELLRRLDVVRPEPLYEYGSFRAAEREIAPAAYYVLPGEQRIIDRVIAHGLRHEVLAEARTHEVERYRVDSVRVSGRTFQGHNEHTYFGRYERATVEVPPGSVLVRTDQPLGRLAFTLLEPRSDDGVAAWGLVEAVPAAGAHYPVWRVPARP